MVQYVDDIRAIINGTGTGSPRLLSNTLGQEITIGYSFEVTGLTGARVSNPQKLTATMQEEHVRVFTAISSVAKINFVEVPPQNAVLRFYHGPMLTEYGPHGVMQPVGSNGVYTSAKVGYDTTSVDGNLHLIAHEVGHALGLKHVTEGEFQLATGHNSVTLYAPNDQAFLDWTGLQPLDIEALRHLYGARGTGIGIGEGQESYTVSNHNGEVVMGGLGYDTIIGGNGNDILHGGRSSADPADHSDSIRGGGGNDLIYGNAGYDTIYGDAGNDTVYGGFGYDRIYGGDGNDYLAGGGGVAHPFDEADGIYGEGGNDFILGNGGNDYASGGDGNDTIFGGLGNDTLYGDAGDDVLIGQNGNDYLWGSTGADRFYYYGGDGVDTIAYFSSDDKILIEANINGTGIATVQDILNRLSGTTLDLGGGNAIQFTDLSTTLGASHFEIVHNAFDSFVVPI